MQVYEHNDLWDLCDTREDIIEYLADGEEAEAYGVLPFKQRNAYKRNFYMLLESDVALHKIFYFLHRYIIMDYEAWLNERNRL